MALDCKNPATTQEAVDFPLDGAVIADRNTKGHQRHNHITRSMFVCSLTFQRMYTIATQSLQLGSLPLRAPLSPWSCYRLSLSVTLACFLTGSGTWATRKPLLLFPLGLIQ